MFSVSPSSAEPDKVYDATPLYHRIPNDCQELVFYFKPLLATAIGSEVVGLRSRFLTMAKTATLNLVKAWTFTRISTCFLMGSCSWAGFCVTSDTSPQRTDKSAMLHGEWLYSRRCKHCVRCGRRQRFPLRVNSAKVREAGLSEEERKRSLTLTCSGDGSFIEVLVDGD